MPGRVKTAIINVVNPRLHNYTNATTIAICVLLANVGAIFVMAHVLQRQCTTTVTETMLRPTIAGDHQRHLEFMEDSLGRAGVTSTDDVTTIVEVDICIKETRAMFTKDPKGEFRPVEPYTTHCDSDGGTPTCVANEKIDYTVDGYLEYCAELSLDLTTSGSTSCLASPFSRSPRGRRIDTRVRRTLRRGVGSVPPGLSLEQECADHPAKPAVPLGSGRFDHWRHDRNGRER